MSGFATLVTLSHLNCRVIFQHLTIFLYVQSKRCILVTKLKGLCKAYPTTWPFRNLESRANYVVLGKALNYQLVSFSFPGANLERLALLCPSPRDVRKVLVLSSHKYKDWSCSLQFNSVAFKNKGLCNRQFI